MIKSNFITHKLLVLYRKINGHPECHHDLGYSGYQNIKGQAANDYIFDLLSSGTPVMISKFGSVELSNFVSLHINETTGITREIVKDFINYNVQISRWVWYKKLCTNAGFFTPPILVI